MGKIKNLRKKYPELAYKNYVWRASKNKLKAHFEFEISPRIKFSPTITIETAGKAKMSELPKQTIDNLVFHLGLAEIPTYWKAVCSPLIRIKAGCLTEGQNNWWKKLILRGMGQFFYENKIDFRKPDFIEIISKQEKQFFPQKLGLDSEKVLVPVGGGKDSAVTFELLRQAGKQKICFGLNPNKPIERTAEKGECNDFVAVKRKIDPLLLALNKKGYLNGHTPFSSYLSFLSVLIAALFGTKYIVFSNERSANEGNLTYLGQNINHQYSKSFEFEMDFFQYSRKYLLPDIYCFSILRPVYEIQIARIFSKYPKYFSSFMSCNEAFKSNSGQKKISGQWCGKCPKCLFVFTMLYPFLETKDIVKIFGENLFEKKALLPLLEKLIGKKGFKPFECVGGKKEVLAGLYLSFKKEQGNKKIPILLEYMKKEFLSRKKQMEKEAQEMLLSWNRENNVPAEMGQILKNEIRNT